MPRPRLLAPRRVAAAAAAVAAVALLAPAAGTAATGPATGTGTGTGTGSTSRAVALKPTPELLRQLRAARSTGVGPLTGRRCFPDGPDTKPVCDTFVVRWARYRGKEYAAAVFWRKETGFTDALIQFVRPVGGRWSSGSDGFPAECFFPAAVNRAWGWDLCADAG